MSGIVGRHPEFNLRRRQTIPAASGTWCFRHVSGKTWVSSSARENIRLEGNSLELDMFDTSCSEQDAQLPQRNCATRYVSWNIVHFCTTVQKIPLENTVDFDFLCSLPLRNVEAANPKSYRKLWSLLPLKIGMVPAPGAATWRTEQNIRVIFNFGLFSPLYENVMSTVMHTTGNT